MAREADAKVAEQAGDKAKDAHSALRSKGVWGTEVDPDVELDEEKLAAALKKQVGCCPRAGILMRRFAVGFSPSQPFLPPFLHEVYGGAMCSLI